MIRGEKFEVDLDEDDQGSDVLQGAFVGDILERRTTTAVAPPKAPALRNRGAGGFPEHRKRDAVSQFKQHKSASIEQQISAGSVPERSDETGAPMSNQNEGTKPLSWEEEEKQRIDAENRQKLAQMSTEEIEEERRELMSSLSPAVLQRLLQRSYVDSGSSETNLSHVEPTRSNKSKASISKNVSFVEPENVPSEPSAIEDEQRFETGEVEESDRPHDRVHFPQPSQPPELDPSSETFLDDLHQKYFPSLPSDPDKLEWMQKSTPTNGKYDPSSSALSPKDIRFSFKGELIPPKQASEIPVIEGLHHHGEAPEAAGYTIPELLHLAHSSYPAQRCIAFQTLGRILCRLGKGEFGDSGEPGGGKVGAEDTFGELARGLWGQVEKEKVIETLVRESEGKGADRGKHQSAKAYATEAVWLWQRAGGRRWKAK